MIGVRGKGAFMANHRFFIVSILMALAIGCSDKPAAKPAATPEPTAAPAETKPVDCATRTADLATWMKALVDEGHRDNIVPDFRKDGTAVRLAAGQATERLPPRGPIVTVRGGDVALSGKLAYRWPTQAPPAGANTESPDLGNLLATEWKALCAQGTGDQSELTLWIDNSAPWWVVRGVVQTAYETGADSVVLAFVKPSAVPAPGPSPIDADIERIEKKIATNTRLLSANEPSDPDHPVEKAYRSCAKAYDLLVLSQNSGFDDAARILTEEIPKEIAACDCNLDTTSIKALHWWWSGRRNPSALAGVGVRLPLAAAGVKQLTPIAVRDDAPWSEAHAKVLAARASGQAFMLVAANIDAGQIRDTASREPRGVCKSQPKGDGKPKGGDFASLTGTADFSSGFDDRDIYGGLIGKEVSGPGPRKPADQHLSPAATAKPGSASVAGDLDKAVIEKIVRRKVIAVQQCFQKALNRNPSLWGTVVTQFVIDAQGKVAHAQAAGLGDRDVEACIEGVVRTLRFPKPAGGGVVNVRYPFVLSAK